MAAAASGFSSSWSKMPGDLVSAILMRLEEVGDLVRAAAVCQWWRHCASSCIRQSLPMWLMVSDEEGEGGHVRQMLSLGEEGKTFLMQLPQIHGMICWGSAVGWVIALDTESLASTGDLFAFNPITGSTLPLPGVVELPWINTHYPSSPPHFPHSLSCPQIIERFVALSSSDSSSVAAVAAIGRFGIRLAFCRPGDPSWTELPNPHQSKDFRGYDDIFFICIDNAIFHRGLLYVVNICGCISFYDLNSSSRGISPPPPRTLYGTIIMSTDNCLYPPDWRMYLVESYHGYLLLVWRQMKTVSQFQTVKIKVYRLMEEEEEEEGNLQQSHWVQLDSLVDEALFIGFGHPMSLSTKDHHYLTTNSIYFTDDTYTNIQGHRWNQVGRRQPTINNITRSYDPDLYIDIGVYNLHYGTVQHLYQEYCSHRKWPPPIWLPPSIHL